MPTTAEASIEPDASQTREPLPPVEDEANVFAAAVLMPARLIREQYVRCERDFFLLCETFGASGAAAARCDQARELILMTSSCQS